MSCPRCQLTSRLKAHQIFFFAGRLWNVAFFVSSFTFHWWSPPPPPCFQESPLVLLRCTLPILLAHDSAANIHWTWLCLVFSYTVTVHVGLVTFSDQKNKTHHKQSRPLARLGHSRTLYTEPRLTRWVKRRHLYCNLSPWEKHRNVPSMF